MIVLITGPSGAGKSSFIGRLMASDPRLSFSISTTTRPIRAGETDGVDYDFVDETRFDELLRENAFVEHAVVHGNRYGTRHARLEGLAARGRIPVLDIDVQGGLQVIPRFGPELVSVFLFPPSWEALEQRLRNRGTDDDEVIARRLANARGEVAQAHHYEWWIVNDELEEAVLRMQAVIAAAPLRREAWQRPPLVP